MQHGKPSVKLGLVALNWNSPGPQGTFSNVCVQTFLVFTTGERSATGI